MQKTTPETTVSGMDEVKENEDNNNNSNNDNEYTSQITELLNVLKEHENAPDEYTLNSWKMSHGKFFASSIEGSDVYIWRTLKRLEHRQIVSQQPQDGGQDLFENQVIKRCLLWPTPNNDFISTTDAGTIPTLYKQIMHQSGFVNDEYAISMIRRL